MRLTAAQAAKFVASVYLQRAAFWYAARVRGDLFSRLNYPPTRSDPYPVYEVLRAQGPLIKTSFGSYCTTSYAVSSEVLRSRDFGVSPLDGSRDRAHLEVLDYSLLELNPPDHTRLRRLAAPSFSPKRMAGLQPLVDRAISRLLDAVPQDEPFDLMDAFALPVPIAVMTALIGLPDDPVTFRRLGAAIAKSLDGVWSLRQVRVLYGVDRELHRTFRRLAEERAADPRDDLVSALVADQGERISPDELEALGRVLLLAGFETTVNAIGSGVQLLLADREQWELLVAEPERIPAAAEEILRFAPPVQQLARVAHRPVEVVGVALPANTWVLPLLGAANRDPAVFPEPGRFDITRVDPAEHLTFSGGIHYCIGSPLARMELVQALRALVERFPKLRLAGDVTMRSSMTLRGPLLLPVQVT